jgi:NTP pyrophosphatase (non-canonical NTP hydrolase)
MNKQTDTQVFQMGVGKWHKEMFPNADAEDILCKLVEEVGELCHETHSIKWGGATTQKYVSQVDAVGDIMIVLAAFCEKAGIDLDQAIADTWSGVSSRAESRVKQ